MGLKKALLSGILFHFLTARNSSVVGPNEMEYIVGGDTAGQSDAFIKCATVHNEDLAMIKNPTEMGAAAVKLFEAGVVVGWTAGRFENNNWHWITDNMPIEPEMLAWAKNCPITPITNFTGLYLRADVGDIGFCNYNPTQPYPYLCETRSK